jgi:hypothetical protein
MSCVEMIMMMVIMMVVGYYIIIIVMCLLMLSVFFPEIGELLRPGLDLLLLLLDL